MDWPRIFGLFLVLLVVFIWVGSSFLTQDLYSAFPRPSPFFLTYFNTATFSIFLLPSAFRALLGLIAGKRAVENWDARGAAWATWWATYLGRARKETAKDEQEPGQRRVVVDGSGEEGVVGVVAGTTTRTSEDREGLLAANPATLSSSNNPADYIGNNGSSSNGRDSPLSPISTRTPTSSVAIIDPDSPAASLPENEIDDETDLESQMAGPPMATWKLSLLFCLLWFAANYASNLALSLTSVSSATILSSTSGLWTLILGRLLHGTRVDYFKLAAVLLSLAGVVIVSLDDHREAQPRTLPGDIAALLSALFYALYSLLLSKLPPSASPVLFLGFVGLWNAGLLWPAFIPLHILDLEPFPTHLSNKAIAELLLNGLVGTALSDLLWLLAVLLTTPLIVTVGLSLTIPLAILGDSLLKSTQPTPLHLIGGAMVVLGFVGVNLGKAAAKKIVGCCWRNEMEGFVEVPGGPDEEGEGRKEEGPRFPDRAYTLGR